MEILCLGLSHHTAPVELRERFAIPDGEIAAATAQLKAAPGVAEAVVISTCNRVEIYLAAEQGRAVQVYAGETRPLLQGSRLTAWELAQAGIHVTVLADSMAAALMRDGAVDLVIVGADRIAANGDVANKIGTYALAIAARHHDIPFYVAAPRPQTGLRMLYV